MLGRKAILHSGRAAGVKRKWQVEIDKDSDAESSDEEEGVDVAERLDEALDPGSADAAKARVATPGSPTKLPKKEEGERLIGNEKGHEGQVGKEKKADAAEDDDDDSEDDAAGGKSKRFAWMDSEDEASDGDEEEEAGKAAVPDTSFPPKPPGATVSGLGANGLPPVKFPAGAKLLAALRSPSAASPLTSLALPSGTEALPVLSMEHLALMAKINAARNLSDFWDLAERSAQEFAAGHAAFALHRLSVLASGGLLGEGTPAHDLAVARHKSFDRLRDRLDELLATEKGRASFLPADLAIAACSLAKVVPLPATEGATGRIFADIADEAESRILAAPSAFTASMLADLAWGISKSGNSKTGFLRAIVDAVVPRLTEATCQDIATFAAAFVEHTFDEAEVLLHGVFQQAKQRLGYRPPLQASLNIAAIQAAMGVTPQAGGAAASLAASPAGDTASSAAASGTSENGSASGGVAAEGSTATASQPAKAKLPAWQLVGHWKFSCGQISDISSAASKRLSLFDEALFTLVAQHFIPRLQEFNGLQLQKLREAFELMRHDVNGEFMKALRAAQLLPKNRLGYGVPASTLPRTPANLLDPKPRTR